MGDVSALDIPEYIPEYSALKKSRAYHLDINQEIASPASSMSSAYDHAQLVAW
jgi:hypothetical protein